MFVSHAFAHVCKRCMRLSTAFGHVARLSWPSDASTCADKPHKPTWDPFAPCESKRVPSQPSNGLADWGAFTDAASVPATNPNGGSGALGATNPNLGSGALGTKNPNGGIGALGATNSSWGSGSLGATNPNGGSGALSSSARLSSSSDWHSALEMPLDSPFSWRGLGVDGGDTQAGGADACPVKSPFSARGRGRGPRGGDAEAGGAESGRASSPGELRSGTGSDSNPGELTPGARSDSNPGELTTAAGSEISPRELPTGAGSESSPRELPMGAGSGRRPSGLPPLHQSSFGKGGSAGSGLTPRSTGGLPNNAMLERRSESWGSFTEAARACELGGRASDLESWGSFRQPSDDGACLNDGNASGSGPEGGLDGGELEGEGRLGLEGGESEGGDRSAREGIQPVGRAGDDESDVGDSGVLRAMSVGLPDRHGGRAEMTASISTPSLLTEGRVAGAPPRKDSALELDLLSRFMKEAIDVPTK